MSTNHTTNYDLNQWEGTDKVLRTEFNADNAKIDAALKANADAIAANMSAMEHKGNCQLWMTSYVGTGETGYNETNRITFPKQPYVVIIQGVGGERFLVLRGSIGYQAMAGKIYGGDIMWEGNTLSWSYTASNISPELPQFNRVGATYLVLALLPADE